MKKYKTIYADPPWLFNDKLDDTRKLIDEKIGDEIVYLTLLEGLLVERIRNG